MMTTTSQPSGEERYYHMRSRRRSDFRPDGSLYNPEVDRQAAAAEEYVCGVFGVPYVNGIYDYGDGGYDFLLRLFNPDTQVKVDVVLTGTDYLIVNPYGVKIRVPNVFILVHGSIELGFRIVGWLSRDDLLACPKRDFGYGEKYACHISKLQPISKLLDHAKKEAPNLIQENKHSATCGN